MVLGVVSVCYVCLFVYVMIVLGLGMVFALLFGFRVGL